MNHTRGHLSELCCPWSWLSATNGVVIATEKKMPSVLIDEKQMQKVELINPSTGEYVTPLCFPSPTLHAPPAKQ